MDMLVSSAPLSLVRPEEKPQQVLPPIPHSKVVSFREAVEILLGEIVEVPDWQTDPSLVGSVRTLRDLSEMTRTVIPGHLAYMTQWVESER